MKDFFLFLKLLSQNFSPLRIFQIIELRKISVVGKTIEFGAQKKEQKNFTYYINEKRIEYSNIFTDRKSKIFYADLTKKINIKSQKYSNILIFNVLEHLDNHNQTFNELHRILKKNGNLIGSTPFLYQIHGAPKDFFRFTKDFFLEKFKKKGFRKTKIISLGYGPFVACFSILFSYIKYLPLINLIIFIVCYLLDVILQIFVKTKLNEIYPIGFFFIAKK